VHVPSHHIAWITGASRGIGAATAIALAERHVRVVLSARHSEGLQKMAQTITENGGRALIVACDVGKKDQVERAVATIKKEWGAITLLVNNAGTAVFRKIVDTKEDDWDLMMNVNLKSAFLCTQAVLPDMIAAQEGHIINIVSVAGRQAFYNCGGYCASKFGLQGFTDVLRMEVRKHGIKVTAVLPGATDTSIWGTSQVDRSRMMKPENIGNAIADLCASTVTGMVEELVIRPQGGDL
jgi:short-subunit dehydrogenase